MLNINCLIFPINILNWIAFSVFASKSSYFNISSFYVPIKINKNTFNAYTCNEKYS